MHAGIATFASIALLSMAATTFGATIQHHDSTAVAVDEGGRPAARARPKPHARQLVMKLRPGADACVGCRLANGQRLGTLAPGSRLDQLFSTHGVRSARRLRRHLPASGGAAGTRFPVRTRRAPASARAPEFERTWVLRLERRGNLGAVAREIAGDPAVEYCEPDQPFEIALVPDDPFFASTGSWGQPFDDLWGPKRIGAPAAWDVTRGAGVLVAIVDTGIDAAHPDIAANVWSNPGEIAANGLDDDGNGFVDDVRGWDFFDDDADPHDDNLHGTHVAGTVAAVGNNGAGVVGVAYESRVMAVRGLGTQGYGFSSDLAEAILYAVDNGADVINASWGGTGASQTLADAVAAAHAAGVVFVAAAGNAASDAKDFFPAADPHAVAVAAFTYADVAASFSNFGLVIDIGAPGGGDAPPPNGSSSSSILSLLSGDLNPDEVPPSELVIASGGASYLRIAGTSMASPHVAGTAALVLAHDPSLTVEQVRQLLRTTADDLPPAGRDDASGYGLVDAAAAVAAPAPLEAHLAAPADTRLIGPTTVDVIGSATGPGFVSYTLDYRPAADPTGWAQIAGPIGTPVDGGVLTVWDASVVADGDYVLRLRVERPGETFVDETAIRVQNVQIAAPAQLSALRADAPVEIRGTAAGPGFISYAVETRRPALDGTTWHTDGVTLAGAPGTPVRHGLLATVDVSSLTEGDRFDFRLSVTTATGTLTAERKGITVDPALRAGWPQDVIPGSDREYLTVADLDGIGTQSILVGSVHEVVVFEHDGSLRPGWPQSVVLDDGFTETRASPLVADVLGDARPEVIATNGRYLLVWSADGVLQAPFPQVVPALANGGNEWISAGNVDGDGKDEVVCASNRGLDVIRGDGTTIWTSSVFYGRVPAVGQVLGDPIAEVARWRAASDRDILTGRGYVDAFTGGGSLLAQRKVRGATFTRVGIADMDGDGRGDFFVPALKPTSVKQKIAASAATADGLRLRLRKPRLKGPQLRPSLTIAMSDIDRDGFAEAWQYGRVARPDYFEDEFGHFAPWQSKLDPTPLLPLQHRVFSAPLFRDGVFGVAIGDVDGDGVQELVGGMVADGCPPGIDVCTSTRIRRAVVIQRLDGSLLPGFPRPVPQWFNESEDPTGIGISAFIDDPRAATPAITDLDGDGLKEIVWWDPEASRIFVWNVPGTPGLLLADWPMYAHDPKHSNALPPALP